MYVVWKNGNFIPCLMWANTMCGELRFPSKFSVFNILWLIIIVSLQSLLPRIKKKTKKVKIIWFFLICCEADASWRKLTSLCVLRSDIRTTDSIAIKKNVSISKENDTSNQKMSEKIIIMIVCSTLDPICQITVSAAIYTRFHFIRKRDANDLMSTNDGLVYIPFALIRIYSKCVQF